MRPLPGKLVDGVFRRALWVDLGDELKGTLRVNGLDVTVPLPEEVPRPVWSTAIALTAGALFPREPHPLQLRRLGRHLVVRLEEQRVIRGPWLSMARLAGPRRSMERLASHLHKAPVHLELVTSDRSSVEMRVEEREQTEFVAGFLEGLLAMLGAAAPVARVGPVSGELTTFVVAWR